uniref:Kelch-like protein 18 n=3 Tax=Schistocephalus solidus TaxID=70667 RepID=A0A0X3NR66_SCHSO
MALSDVVVFEDRDPLYRACPALSVIRQENSVPDVQLRLNDKHMISVHRIIIAARIPAWKDRFGGLSEGGIISLEDQSHKQNIIQHLIDYAYTGQIEISLENVEDLLYYAVNLRLIPVEKCCYRFLINRLTLENLYFVMRIANNLQAGTLKKACHNLMRSQFENFVGFDMFYNLPLENLLSLLRSSNLGVHNEEQVVNAICDWVLAEDSPQAAGACGESRMNVLPQLLAEVRWQKVSSEFQDELVQKCSKLETPPQARKLLNEMLKWIGLFRGDSTGSKAKICAFNSAERSYMENVLVTIGTPRLGDRREWILQIYDPENDKDAIISRIKRRKNAAIIMYDDQIFIIGGIGRDRNTNLVKAFSVKTRRGRLAASMSEARGEASASRVGDAIVVCGGSGVEYEELASCELFLPKEDRWIPLPPLAQARRALTSVAIPDGRLFVIGGLADSEYFSCVEYCCVPEQVSESGHWQPEEGGSFWQPAASMNRARCFLSACEHAGYIFAAGGLSHSSTVVKSVEMFQPPTIENPLGQWTLVQSMHQAREEFSLISHRNSLFALGHYRQPSDSVEQFHLPNRQLASKPFHSLFAVVGDGQQCVDLSHLRPSSPCPDTGPM